MSQDAEVASYLLWMLANTESQYADAAAGWRSENPFVVASLFAKLGYLVFPSSETKTPWTPHGFFDATANPFSLVDWERRKHPPGWSIRTGRSEDPNGPAGVWDFDIDDAVGYARLAELEAELGPLPPTWTCKSARLGGGEHRMFRPAADGPDMKTVGGALIHGKRGKIDQRGRGGYAVIAGSLHKSGKRYCWKEGCAPDEIGLADLPPAWVEAMDKADQHLSRSPRQRRTSGVPRVRREHDVSSILIGDGPGYGGFDRPLYLNAIQYFFTAGFCAPAEVIIETLREIILAAPKDHGRDVTRYLSGPDLPRIVERARSFVIEVKEDGSVEYQSG